MKYELAFSRTKPSYRRMITSIARSSPFRAAAISASSLGSRHLTCAVAAFDRAISSSPSMKPKAEREVQLEGREHIARARFVKDGFRRDGASPPKPLWQPDRGHRPPGTSGARSRCAEPPSPPAIRDA